MVFIIQKPFRYDLGTGVPGAKPNVLKNKTYQEKVCFISEGTLVGGTSSYEMK